MYALNRDCFTTISIPSVEKLRVFHSIPYGVENPPRLLFLHGYSFFTDLYAPLLNKLCPHFEVLAFDSPGTGWSGPMFDNEYTLNSLTEVALELLTIDQLRWVPRTAAVMYKANMQYNPDTLLDSQSPKDQAIGKSMLESLSTSTDRKKFIIVGHSMGAFLAAELTTACWNCVEAAYLIAPAGINCRLKNYWSDLCSGVLGVFKKQYALLRHKAAVKKWVEAQRDTIALDRSVTHATQMQDIFTEAYMNNSKAAATRFCSLTNFPWSGGHSVFKYLESLAAQKRLNVQCYLMEEDEIIEYSEISTFFRDSLPNCRLHTIPSANHDWVNDRPRLLASNIINAHTDSTNVSNVAQASGSEGTGVEI